ncbi:MAG TPA: serine protease [Pyrinomonadaceae bacterium]|nr:serine protease [Pyrinomonadaceae bacterium]
MSLLLLATHARAQEEHIYLIKMFDCAHQPTQRSQTGFQVRGTKGLITALHGVIDCQRVMASSRKGLVLDQPLNVVKTDIDHDVALLSSPQLEIVDVGLESAPPIAWELLATVKVYGHPYGISNLETTLTLRKPPLKPLKDLVPPTPLSFLLERRSPNHLINVLNLQGNLLPGHSGAPILDSSDRVVGVANGGLREGFAGISWAIPFRDIEWDIMSLSYKRLHALKQLDPNEIFMADSVPTTLSNEFGYDLCGRISRLIAESRTGFILAVGVPIDDEIPGRFQSKIELPGAISSLVSPNDHISYIMYKTVKAGVIESQYYNLVGKIAACLPDWERKQKLKNTQRFQRYMFRKDSKSPLIVISYNLDPDKPDKLYNLSLTIYLPSKFSKSFWD